MEREELIRQAKEALRYAYAPYSNFLVGAAALTDSGKVYTGCNIENAAYGATNCAERTAIFKAISEGERKIRKIAIVSAKGGPTYPCGICRQVLAEFMEEDGEILLEEAGRIQTLLLKELLPYAFRLKEEKRTCHIGEEERKSD